MQDRRKGRGPARRNKRPSGRRAEKLYTAETGAVVKPGADRIAIALCYPSSYAVAMGNLGFHQVYHLFNAYDDAACERAVMGAGGLKTIESGRALSELEIIAFSISYETDIANAALMLHQAGVPLDPVP